MKVSVRGTRAVRVLFAAVVFSALALTGCGSDGDDKECEACQPLTPPPPPKVETHALITPDAAWITTTSGAGCDYAGVGLSFMPAKVLGVASKQGNVIYVATSKGSTWEREGAASGSITINFAGELPMVGSYAVTGDILTLDIDGTPCSFAKTAL